MHAKEITEFKSYYKEIRKFCVNAVKDSHSKITKRNYDFATYKFNSASLLNRLYIKKSFLFLSLFEQNIRHGLYRRIGNKNPIFNIFKNHI